MFVVLKFQTTSSCAAGILIATSKYALDNAATEARLCHRLHDNLCSTALSMSIDRFLHALTR